ncbi:MAG: glucose-1-phosphate cytidylyltransferase [Gemmatimonadaceae bacterium]
MKVVLFCGGLGTRLRAHAEPMPKPLVNIGIRPIIWHLMRYYAHFGHTDFVLCLGYRGDLIRDYFLNYNECLSNDFTLSEGCRRVELLSTDTDDWRITFADTGLHSNIGERLLRVRKYLEGEPVFLANYADGLSDLPIDRMIADFNAKQVVASVAGVCGSLSFHTVDATPEGFATGINGMSNKEVLINGGFFVLRQSIFDYIEKGDELLEQPFQRLIEKQLLAVYRHDGFWRAMDTFKDKITFDRMEAQGVCPWMVWKR